MTPVIAMAGMVKAFGGTRAVDAVDFDVRPHEVHALLGGNGAGKSTLIKLLAGVHHADAGDIRVHGVAVDPATTRLPKLMPVEHIVFGSDFPAASPLDTVNGLRAFGLDENARARIERLNALSILSNLG